MTAPHAGLDAGTTTQMAGFAATHFGWSLDGAVATITLNRPERKNPSHSKATPSCAIAFDG